MLLIFLAGVLGVLVVAALARRGVRARSFRPPAEERALIERASKGDVEAAAELTRRGAAEEAELKARAANDPTAAREFLERKQSQLQALGWARESLREGSGRPDSSPEQGEQVRARIERQYEEAAREVEWARGRLGR